MSQAYRLAVSFNGYYLCHPLGVAQGPAGALCPKAKRNALIHWGYCLVGSLEPIFSQPRDRGPAPTFQLDLAESRLPQGLQAKDGCTREAAQATFLVL